MKNSKSLWLMMVLLAIFATSCEKTEDTNSIDAVELPPMETLALDLDDFMSDPSESAKTSLTSKTGNNWIYPRVVVGFWNTALFTTLAVPVASFRTAFAHKPVAIADNKWQWTYTVDGFSGQYTSRLTGELRSDQVIWEMYITRTGVESFEEFLWFSGTSARDGSNGGWTLYQSADRPNRMLEIDWERENDEVGRVRYTWVRELNDNDETDRFRNSYLEYGRQDADYNVYYNIHAFDENIEDFVDVNIEWHSTNYNGRVRSMTYFEDDAWHCWNSMGEDALCE